MTFSIIFDKTIQKNVKKFAKDVVSNNFNLVYSLREIDKETVIRFLDESRGQVRADKILIYMYKLFGPFMLITNEDIFVPGLNFVFGVALSGKGVVISTFRLKIEANEKLFYERLAKTIKHELGHYFGLNHCDNLCVMKFANSLLELDLKHYDFCDKCRARLLKRGALKQI